MTPEEQEITPGFNILKEYYMKNLTPLIDEFVILKLKKQQLHDKGIKNSTVGLALDSVMTEIVTILKML
jgi:hypothetical protein